MTRLFAYQFWSHCLRLAITVLLPTSSVMFLGRYFSTQSWPLFLIGLGTPDGPATGRASPFTHRAPSVSMLEASSVVFSNDTITKIANGTEQSPCMNIS